MEYLTAAEAAELMRITPNALALMRSRNRGPTHLKIGRRVYYTREAIAEWADAHAVEHAPGPSSSAVRGETGLPPGLKGHTASHVVRMTEKVTHDSMRSWCYHRFENLYIDGMPLLDTDTQIITELVLVYYGYNSVGEANLVMFVMDSGEPIRLDKVLHPAFSVDEVRAALLEHLQERELAGMTGREYRLPVSQTSLKRMLASVKVPRRPKVQPEGDSIEQTETKESADGQPDDPEPANEKRSVGCDEQ